MGNSESNVGARIFLIGKDGVVAGIREITAATARLNAAIAEGAGASKAAAAGSKLQLAGLEKLGVGMAAYQDELMAANARTAASYDAMAAVGKKAFWGIAAAAAVVSYESIKWASAYQTQMVSLRVQAGLTARAVSTIGAAAKANSASLGLNATEYLQAAYHPASTGMGTAETIAITNNAAKLAAMSGGTATPEDTSNALTGVMKSYNLGAGQTQKTAATLLAIVGAGNMRFGDLNAALSSGVASTASTFGVNLSSLGSALAFATDRGTPAAQAGTRLRMAMSLIGAPSATSTKFLTAAGLSSSNVSSEEGAMTSALAASGLSVSDLSTEMRKGGIQGALQMLHRDLTSHKVSAAWQAAFLGRAFGGGKMGSAITQMYDNVPGLNQKVSQIDKNSTQAAFTQKWADTQATLNFQLHKFSSEIHNIGITFGTALLPPLTKVLSGLTAMVGFLGQNKALVIALGTAVTAVLVPAIGVYLYRALLGNGKALSTVLNGYKNLITGQGLEAGAAKRTALALDTDTAASGRLVGADRLVASSSRTAAAGMGAEDAALVTNDAALGVNDAALGTNAADRTLALGAGASKVSRIAAGVSKVAPYLGAAALGYSAAQHVQHDPKSPLRMYSSPFAELGDWRHKAASITDSAVHDIARIGGTGVHDVKSVWHDIFGGGDSNSHQPAMSQSPTVINVYVDGKLVQRSVTKRTKADAARS